MMDTDLTDENYDLANAEAEGEAIRREMAEEMGTDLDDGMWTGSPEYRDWAEQESYNDFDADVFDPYEY